MHDIVWHKVSPNSFTQREGLDIWRIRISSNLPLLNKLQELLLQAEFEKAKRYHKENDRNRFIISRGMLRLLLGKYLKLEPANIQLVAGINKKPFVQNISASDLHYNVSHSGDWILIAISNSDVGADVEKIDENFSYSEILQQNFSKQEIDFIKNGKKPAEHFYLLWTRKEALLKATSKGIDNDLPFVPSLDGNHITDHKIIGSDENFCVSSFMIDENYIGSLAYKKSHQPFSFYDINEFSFSD